MRWVELSHILGNWMTELEGTPQNPQWHAEGDVLRHTQMVCQALESLDAYRNADENTQTILYLAAALHDVGKTGSRCVLLVVGQAGSHDLGGRNSG